MPSKQHVQQLTWKPLTCNKESNVIYYYIVRGNVVGYHPNSCCGRSNAVYQIHVNIIITENVSPNTEK